MLAIAHLLSPLQGRIQDDLGLCDVDSEELVSNIWAMSRTTITPMVLSLQHRSTTYLMDVQIDEGEGSVV